MLLIPLLPLSVLRPLLVRALAEDLGHGDVTTHALDIRGKARGRVLAQAEGVVAGLPLLETLFHLLDRDLKVRPKAREGQRIHPGQNLAEISGAASSLLAGERTALNLLMHCSGIATLTSRYVDAVRGTGVSILDTRKTLPGLRELQKYAVAVGEGINHRFGLYDQILVKNNHLALLNGGTPRALRQARRRLQPGVMIEVEARTLKEALAAAGAGADIVLLDNFTPAGLKAAVKAIRRRYPSNPLLEASGGITLANLRAVALSGVDRVSVGALTHSAPALPMAMRLSRR